MSHPFKDRTKKKKEEKKAEDFDITFTSSKEYEKVFETQINAIMNIWNARIQGKNINGNVIFSLEFAGEIPETEEFKVKDCTLQNGSFEIRIYHLQQRQPHGIRVGEARDYLNTYGGIYVYDAGFQLPYYGDPKNDWLKIEFDHSHRLTSSKLLPEKYQIKGGLQFLPTLSRILGVVNVNTSEEKDLDILITRDRLQNSTALTNLENIVRYTLDYYAHFERVRSEEKKERIEKVIMPKSQRIEEVFDKYRDKINKIDLKNMEEEVQEVINNYESEAEIIANKVSFLGPVATAGLTHIAVQHETKWQIKSLDVILEKINSLNTNVKEPELRNQLKDLKSELTNWATRAKQQQSLLSYFNDPENIENKKRMTARRVIEDIIRQVRTLSEGVKYDLSELEYQLLPESSMIEWSSIFQNVLINAFNAMVDTPNKRIKILIKTMGRDRELLIQDNGVGIDLTEAESFFEPFKRKIVISEEKKGLGYGGLGLGLTIVRLVAMNIGCSVGFTQPEVGYSTAFSLKWREKK